MEQAETRRTAGLRFAFAAGLAALAGLAMNLPASAADVAVDCAKTGGEIRPLHGVNSGPLVGGETIDLSTYHKDIAVPYTRLHDCLWPNADVVDIHAVFPNPAADPGRAENYDFRRTDDYVGAIVKAGSQIVYRLGESIEHSRRKYYVHPPADNAQWAAVSLGVIRHYNEGWAGGFRYGIRYWEVWNEPENRPAMWSGSDEDYYRLYGATAKAIKSRWPDLKVGGPGAGAAGEVAGDVLRPTAFLKGLLEYCRRESAPLDFFSWHVYTDDPGALAARARAVRRWLDGSGFAKTESHLNEWNYLPAGDWTPMLGRDGKARQAWYEAIGGCPGAAFAAAVLVGLQDCPVDVANYYTADLQGFGLFNGYGVPRKPYYAFKAFKALLDTPVRVEASGSPPGRLAVAAGIGRAKTEATVLISNLRSARETVNLVVLNLPWDGPAAYEILVLDGARDLEKVRAGRLAAGEFRLAQDVEGPSVCLIRIRKPAAGE